jgi:hypothetical protein
MTPHSYTPLHPAFPSALVESRDVREHHTLTLTPALTPTLTPPSPSPSPSHCKVGKWLLDYMNSEETSCCYLADGAEAQQLERLGQLLSRRVDGKLQVMALDLNTVESKTAEAQAAAFKQSIEEAIQLMEEAGMVDARAAELLRRFMPTCAMNDRASPARAAARKVLGLADGDNDPTCAEHGLVNILEEGRKAMDKVMHELMNITEEQARG